MEKTSRDLTGSVFGRLTVVEYAGTGRWRCSCECGGEACCLTSNLKKGNSKSCGCANREARFKHGMSKTPVYKAWQMMRDRCENSANPHFHNYGGRGIAVCERWQEFSNFLADMGMRPKGFDIDREDNDKGYEPGNCRWVTRKRNMNNLRGNNRIEYDGQSRTVPEWAEILGMHEETLRHRVNRGWTAERAIETPIQRKNPSKYSVRQRLRKPSSQ